jgi:hypothetical protein
MQLADTRIEVFHNDKRTKLILPLQRNALVLTAWSLLVLVWLSMLVLFIYSIFVPPPFFNAPHITPGYRVGWRVLLIVWVFFWARFVGRYLLRWWQFHLADREVLLEEDGVFIVRRPVSIFGITNAYALQHMHPFYENETHACCAFQYGGVQHHLFGMGLEPAERTQLLTYLNDRFFPGYDEYDEDEEEEA